MRLAQRRPEVRQVPLEELQEVQAAELPVTRLAVWSPQPFVNSPFCSRHAFGIDMLRLCACILLEPFP